MQKTELNRYREELIEMRIRLREDVSSLVDGLPELAIPPGNISNLPTHNADRDSEGFDIEARLEEAQADILNQVDEALDRIEAGTYGRCIECDSQIVKARLEALPYTPYCTRCAGERSGD